MCCLEGSADLVVLWSLLQQVESRQHPFPAKLTADQAEEVRRLRARGVPLAELAGG